MPQSSKSRSRFAVCLLLLTCLPCLAERSRNGTERKLHAFFDREWEYRLQQNPTMASSLGDRRWNDRWEDLSPGAFEARTRHTAEALGTLRKIDRHKMGGPDRLNYDLFQRELSLDAEEVRFRWDYIALNQREGIQTADQLADDLRFGTAKDFQDWIGRLNRFGAYMDQTIALMREGIRIRRVLPKIIVGRIPAQIAKQRVADPAKSPFFKPFLQMPSALVEADQESLRRAGREAIMATVLPAFERLDRFIATEYLPAAFDEVGIWQMPDGAELYRFLARKFTTTSMTPDEIHETGLREVQRIREGMERVRARVDFHGPLRDFFQYLRTDAKFFPRDAESLLAAYRAASKKVDPLLVQLFRTLPRIPYGVEAIPEKIAPDTTTAYYRPPAADGSRAGFYTVNLYRPETRPLYEIMALTLHEAVPGHHLQIALSMEQGELPHFRRYGGYTAFVEGWALYAESLGEELGLYADPYDKMGQLTYEMWRAVRLVVDTGIHAKRWSRQRAIDFFMENAPKTEPDVINEIDRYIAWPGQALAYKIGELKIKELRAFAAKELGAKFDLKAFHDVVLLSGALPLDVLEMRVREFVNETKKQG